MSGRGGGDAGPPLGPVLQSNGGEFLLSLLQRPSHHQQQQPPSQFPPTGHTPFLAPQPQQQQQHQHFAQRIQPHQPLPLDPAVAAVGPSFSFPQPSWGANARDLVSPSLPPHGSLPPEQLGFPPNYWPSPNQFQAPTSQPQTLIDDLQRLGFTSIDASVNNAIQGLLLHKQQQQQVQHHLQFGSFQSEPQIVDNAAKELEKALGNAYSKSFEKNPQSDGHLSSSAPRDVSCNVQDRSRAGNWGKQQQQEVGNHNAIGQRKQPPPGFSNQQKGGLWDNGGRGREFDSNIRRERGNNHPSEHNSRGEWVKRANGGSLEPGITRQLDTPGPPSGSNLHSVSGSEVEASMMHLHSKLVDDEQDDDGRELDDHGEELVDSLLREGEPDDGGKDKKQGRNSREKEARSDDRGQRMLSQRMRMFKRQMVCRRDIERFNRSFLAIYESLIPPEEEKEKQKQLLTMLEKLVNKEWPEARLFLYGSCANSFGVSKSDVDVCLAIEDGDTRKSEILLRLADILQSDNLQNVQALIRARVPIVKLMDPASGISCDICINNVLAVVNTKLLRDYAQIDVRLRQLAYIVKHWAKSRAVNETYHGTLSSYAYVLMCIHFLQQRRPAILPCLQRMEATYSVTVDGVQCAYFDQVEKLQGWGSRNRETIAELVWGFFYYWAYCHDYANTVASVRMGRTISKREKDWTRRVGNDRHLICIEDPFEVSHDLGRVVDKFSIRVLREEFERAADIMQHDSNPCGTLFQPYVPPSS
ncbi:unnamed protein product [Linum trigynum]|uniref:RNA uridylyltransferase n=1 Tax=Linum trigynum TaxID=586398 RepID=A0AAV2CMJ6_9ROSI